MKSRMYSKKGMSLIEVMVVVGILSVVSLGTLTLFDSLSQVLSRSKATYDRMEMSALVNDILFSTNACTLSLNDPAGSPFTFNKVEVDEPNNGEGKAIESLWFTTADGSGRSKIAITTTDHEKKFFGKLEILSMKLVMDNEVGAYDPSVTSDRGNIIIEYKIKGLPEGTNIKSEAFPMWVQFTTDSSGISTVQSCSKTLSGLSGSGGGSGVASGLVVPLDLLIKDAANGNYKVFGLGSLAQITNTGSYGTACGPGSTATLCVLVGTMSPGTVSQVFNDATDHLFISEDLYIKTSNGYSLCQFDLKRNTCTVNKIAGVNFKITPSTGYCATTACKCPDRLVFSMTPTGLKVTYVNNNQSAASSSASCVANTSESTLYFTAE